MTSHASISFRDVATDAVVFWERGRIAYNLLLAAATVMVVGLPVNAGFPWLEVAFLAVMANVLYCAGYLPDLVLQFTPWRGVWRHARWLLLLAGCALAGWIALAAAFAMAADFGA